MNIPKKLMSLLLTLMLVVSMTACGAAAAADSGTDAGKASAEAASDAGQEIAAESQETAEAPKGEEQEAEDAAGEKQAAEGLEEDAAGEEEESQVEKNGEVVILFTSDVHCGVNNGFGLDGLWQIRQNLEKAGFTTILVDDGDAIMGGPIGTLSKGGAIIDLMNAAQYDVAIPGNHEFDYGVERFLELADQAEFPYISCNFNKEGEPVFDPYIILEEAGMKIAFVGVTTPKTYTSSTPSYFQNEEGEYIYGFLEDDTGEAVYAAVQKAVDDARSEGAEYVYLMAHLGNEAECSPWNYADVVSNTTGIDVVLDGHSHDTDQVVMQNKDGEDVTRSAVGTQLNCLGYSHIVPEEGIVETNIWSWPNDDTASELFGFDNEMTQTLSEANAALEDTLGQVIAKSNVDLTIYDPTAVDGSGNPIRMVRRAETNLGDLCADAYRIVSGADIGFMNGGGIRKNLAKGDITYSDIINVFPFGNELCVLEVTGAQILDALEWTSRAVPGENGGFFQVSGLTYEIDVNVDSPCIEDDMGMFAGVKEGDRRVKNVMVGDEPIDPEKTYTIAATNYTLVNHGDGMTVFDGATVIQNGGMLDNQLLIEYITEYLDGEIGGDYAEPTGQGRITIIDAD